MTAKGEEQAVLFADVSGHARLKEARGVEAVMRLEAATLERLSQTAQTHGGRVLIAEGDELIVLFTTSDQATDAAVDMQVSTNADATDADPFGTPPIPVRIAVHYGPVAVQEDSVTGEAMEMVSWLVDVTQGGQILITQSTRDRLPPMIQDTTRLVDPLERPSSGDVVSLCEVVWQHGDVSAMMDGLLSTETIKRKMKLTCGQRSYTLFEDSPSFVIGRSRKADLAINSGSISREHVMIEFRAGDFMLKDQSRNGTYVVMDGTTHYLKEQELLLTEKGHIFPGDAPVMEGAVDITFQIEIEQLLT